MTEQIKFASGLHVFGSTADRYVLSGYKPAVPIAKMIQNAAKVPDLKGVELVETWHVTQENADDILGQLKKAGLQLSMLIPDLWAQGKWGNGSFTSNDPKIRRDAIETVKRSMDVAAKVGANLVDVWLGQDGYDYCFQSDYIKAWERMIDGLGECAAHNPKVIVGMEYKIKEPRTHCHISTIDRQLMLYDRIGAKNLGVVLDVGHALEGYESMAEVVALCKLFGDRLVYLHLNDNYRLWDDDMAVGSVHLIEYLELLYWLERTGYNGWYSLDIFPYRDDGVGMATESIKWIKDLRRVMLHIGMDKIAEVVESGDAVRASKLVREGMFSLARVPA
ncbi:MAG: sugar phosphate isomerase/epimerase [Anaerolineae bacterium]|nr:sugar phosphate isomerase/epimerase [Anaerolineae bacterium]